MPTYSYSYADDAAGTVFDLTHSTRAVPLAMHPVSGRALTRVFTPFGLTLRAGALRSGMGEKSLAAKGFQRYQRQRDGSYVRTAGTKGPETIRRQP